MKENSTNKIISACIITYNHENYIRECLEGAVRQEVSYPYEIIVGVDKSDDNTKKICEEFQEKYPNLINLVSHEIRLGMKGNSMNTINRCSGKYIAVCEGDDCWTHPSKLQRQVSYLEENPDCSMCYHPTKVVYADKSKIDKIAGPEGRMRQSSHKFSMDEVICGRLGIWTAAIVFKSNVLAQLPSWTEKVTFGDVGLKLFCASKGKIGYLGPEAMSVYNRNVENAWSFQEGKSIEWEEKRLENHFQVLDYFDQFTNFNNHNAIKLQKEKMKLQYFLNMMKFYNRLQKTKLIYKNKSLLVNFKNKLTILIWFRFFMGERIYNKVVH